METFIQRFASAFVYTFQDICRLETWRQLMMSLLSPFISLPVAGLVWLASTGKFSLPASQLTGWPVVLMGLLFPLLSQALLLVLAAFLLGWASLIAAARTAGERHGLVLLYRPSFLVLLQFAILAFILAVVVTAAKWYLFVGSIVPAWLADAVLLAICCSLLSSFPVRIVSAPFVAPSEMAELLRSGKTDTCAAPVFRRWPRTLVCIALTVLAVALQKILTTAQPPSAAFSPITLMFLNLVPGYLLCLMFAHVFLASLSTALDDGDKAEIKVDNSGRETPTAARFHAEKSTAMATAFRPARWQILVLVLIVLGWARSPLMLMASGFNPLSESSRLAFQSSTTRAACAGSSFKAFLHALPGVLDQDLFNRNIACAVANGHLNIIKHYCRFACALDGYGMRLTNNDTATLLAGALIGGHDDIAAYLAEHGAPLSAKHDSEGVALARVLLAREAQTERIIALLKGYPHLVGELQRGNPSAQDAIERHGGAEAVQALERLENLGVNITHLPLDRTSLLDLAVRRKNLVLLDWLLANKYPDRIVPRDDASPQSALRTALLAYEGEGTSSPAYRIVERLFNPEDVGRVMSDGVIDRLGESMLRYPELRNLFRKSKVNFPYFRIFNKPGTVLPSLTGIDLSLLFADMSDVEFESALHGGSVQIMASAGLIDALRRAATMNLEVEMIARRLAGQLQAIDGMCLLFYAALEGKHDNSPGQLDSWQTAEFLARRLAEKDELKSCNPGRVAISAGGRNDEQTRRLKQTYGFKSLAFREQVQRDQWSRHSPVQTAEACLTHLQARICKA